MTGLKDPSTGKLFWYGYEMSSETFWPGHINNPFGTPLSYFKYMVLQNPEWDWKTLRFHDPKSFALMDEASKKLGPVLDSANPDLTPFKKLGGKLIQYHGWIDQNISPRNSISYFEKYRKDDGRPEGDAGFLPALHGARHGALQRRAGPEHPGCAHITGAVGGEGKSAGPDHRHALDRRAKWIVRAHCAPILRLQNTRVPEASMTRPILSVLPNQKLPSSIGDRDRKIQPLLEERGQGSDPFPAQVWRIFDRASVVICLGRTNADS